MDLLEIAAVAVGLSMDAFAVALGVAASGSAPGGRATFRLAFHFGLFQCLMPVAGWLIGRRVMPLIEGIDHWVAFGLLAVVGVRMIRAGLGSAPRAYTHDPTRGLTLVMLAVATSIDALAVGLSLALFASGIWYAAVMIGVITAAVVTVGVRLGRRFGASLGARMEVAGGAILLLVGLRIVVQHLSA